MMKIRHFLPFLILLPLQFCSDGDIGDAVLSQAIAKSMSTYIYSHTDDGSFYNSTLTINNSIMIQVGEDTSDETKMMDGFLTFDISSYLTSYGITADMIVYATVKIYREGYNGKPEQLGNLHVDHVDVITAAQPIPVFASNIYTFPLPADYTWTIFPVTSQLKADLAAGRTYSSYRIYYNSPVVDSTFDYVKFNSASDTYPPYLTVWYL